jgi:ferredoxin--NADP+ reductase
MFFARRGRRAHTRVFVPNPSGGVATSGYACGFAWPLGASSRPPRLLPAGARPPRNARSQPPEGPPTDRWPAAVLIFPYRPIRPFPTMSNFYEAKVLSVHHWTDRQFSFTTTRDPGFRFQSGQFTMIGLMVDGKPLLRAYSVVSPHWDETLEFLSIKVQDGPLTSRLQHIKEGDTVLIGRKASGTLLTQNLLPGKNLYLLSTGTGLAPFMAMIRDPEVYELYEKVILVHGCRQVNELAYDKVITEELPNNEYFGELAASKLIYYPTVTREAFRNQGRIPPLLDSGKLTSDIGLPPIDKENDRFMLCGSPEMLKDTKALFEARGMTEGNMSHPGHYVIERAFVDK